MNEAYLAFCSPLSVGRWDAHGTVSVNSDAEDSVDGTETGGVVD